MELVIPEFPNSYIEPFLLTSPETPHYNCIAWAFEDDTKWYWPDPDDIYYWPSEISREITIDSFIELYSLKNYTVCNSSDFELGIEKIAIFTDANGFPTHAARQLENGLWTSKLGQSNDIQHTIFAMNNSFYGNATVFMSRPKI